MAHFSTTVAAARSPQEVFDYLADMRNAASWDPGVLRAEIVNGVPAGADHVGEGTEFAVTLNLAGRRRVVTYRVTGYDPPEHVVLRADEAGFCSDDTITVSRSLDGGSVANYDAVLSTSGAWRVLSPLVALAFGRIGRRAAAGLQRELGR